jgi:hypothetical protein
MGVESITFDAEVEELEEVELPENRELVRVHTVANRFEADLLVQALHQEQIPVLLRIYEETAYDGIFVPQKGWASLLVPADCQEAARTLIERVLRHAEQESQLALPGEEEE